MLPTDNIIRTKTEAKGGITEEEKRKLEKHTKLWINRIMRTDSIEPNKIIPAIEGLYKSAGLKKPRVIIVPSPLVAYLAGGLSAAMWYLRKNKKQTDAATSDATCAATYAATSAATYDATSAATYAATSAATRDAIDAATSDATYAATSAATRAATSDATYAATRDATDDATRAATSDATYAATRDATRAATSDATYAATRDATDDATDNKKHWLWKIVKMFTPNAVEFSLGCIRLSWKMYQGGNMWGQYDSYLTACRDILGLTGLKCWDKYKYWEEAAIHGGWRIMHEEFCMVSDFPEFIKTDEQNRPHCSDGASHRWRDGFQFYYWHGVRVSEQIIMHPETLTKEDILKENNVEVRRCIAEKIGMEKYAELLGIEEIDRDKVVSQEAILYRTKEKDKVINDYLYFVKVKDPSTTREYMLGVPYKMFNEYPKNCWDATAMTFQKRGKEYNPISET